MRNRIFKQLTLFGDDFDNAAAGTTADIIVYLRDESENILWASGTDVPADSTSGYAKGCLFIDTDVAAGTGGVYENVGTTTACNFDLTGTITADSVDGTDLVNDSISIEHLDDGILPSHVVKYAGEVTWSGSGATLASTVSGVAATDIVVANFHTLGTEGTILQGAVASSNTITFTLDAANTSNDAVISYMVLRAAA